MTDEDTAADVVGEPTETGSRLRGSLRPRDVEAPKRRRVESISSEPDDADEDDEADEDDAPDEDDARDEDDEARRGGKRWLVMALVVLIAVIVAAVLIVRATHHSNASPVLPDRCVLVSVAQQVCI
ncbi:MAG: hypothetical protein JST73_05045 [Actinobacteria bacterium]|nr:hypothetical protein [Actinomycetota bacterium]